MEGRGFEPPNPKERIYSPPRLANFATPPYVITNYYIIPKFVLYYKPFYQKIDKFCQLVTAGIVDFNSPKRTSEFGAA